MERADLPALALGRELPIVLGADVFFPLQDPDVSVLFVTRDAEHSEGIQNVMETLYLYLRPSAPITFLLGLPGFKCQLRGLHQLFQWQHPLSLAPPLPHFFLL